jgi:protein-tyrosine-phosphatase/predicted ATP-grasp superfamily ATP-dependent carboligase
MADSKVLVFGDDTRSFLTIARSLGRRGLTVHVAPSDFSSAALRSRFIAKTHVLPALVHDGADWTSAVEELLKVERFDLVIPCTDRSLLPLSAHRHRLRELARLAIPEPEHIEILFDKQRTREVAATLGVNLAEAVYSAEYKSAEVVFSHLGAPVVVKPRRSVSLDALHRQELVRIVETPDELERAVQDREPGSYFFEAFFPGSGLGISVLSDAGEIIQAFEHHRIHQAAQGGSSAYRVSAPISQELLAVCKKMVGRIGYTGIAMFEFRRNRAAGAWILLEVNARPWGSMPLSVSAGVDFPYAWYQLLVNRNRLAQAAYRTPVYGRNLDLDIAFVTARTAEMTKWRDRAVFLTDWSLGFARVLTGREKLDSLTLDDPGPAIAELGSLIFRVFSACWRRIPGQQQVRRAVARARLRFALKAATRAGKTPSIAFVCYGNICRSAFAEHAMANALPSLPIRVLVRSAGTYQVDGRLSPGEAMTAARRHGVDLAAHRSHRVTMELLSSTSILIAFDQSNIKALKAQYPRIPCPVILLGSLIETPDRKGEIRDPYGGEPALFDRVFGAIRQGIDVVCSHVLKTASTETRP